ncbi:Protein of unknown function [Pyronema omphalodes CBS 100304]|uniref:Uncharacterized protein n=1 Tax=Pyronema omphalodes (strain CBS 100304) TaxID=1076935 RepID=U4LMZ7_PYROM|nr:Protein of unknown function [Pyronema omphalodes CBS 100304]
MQPGFAAIEGIKRTLGWRALRIHRLRARVCIHCGTRVPQQIFPVLSFHGTTKTKQQDRGITEHYQLRGLGICILGTRIKENGNQMTVSVGR